MYIKFFHGSKISEGRPIMEDWGEEGPLIGPVKNVSITYGQHIKFSFKRDEDANKYQSGRDSQYTFSYWIDEETDCWRIGDMEYGDVEFLDEEDVEG